MFFDPSMTSAATENNLRSDLKPNLKDILLCSIKPNTFSSEMLKNEKKLEFNRIWNFDVDGEEGGDFVPFILNALRLLSNAIN